MSNLPPHPPPPARRRRRRISLSCVVIALVAVVAVLFFARRQIGDRLGRSLDAWLSAAGVFISWQSADWVPGVGVRLHGLALYRDAAKHDRLALFGIVTVIKGDKAWHRWDKLNFKMADTHLVLGNGANETRLEHMDMLLLTQAGRTDLRECRARLQGLRIEANGAFVRASPAGDASGDAAEKQAAQSKGLFSEVNLDWLKSAKEWLKFQPEKDEPVLRLEMHSFPDVPGMDLAMTFEGTRFQWRGQKWDFIQAAAKSSVGGKKSPIEIGRVQIGHAGRKAEIAGAFDSAGGILRISKLDSEIDLLALARTLVPDAVGSLSAARTTGTWRISGAGEIPVDHPENARWNASLALDGDFVYASGGINVVLQKPAFAVHASGQVVSISDFKAGLWDGTLEVPAMQVHLPSKEKQLRFETQLILGGARPQSMINSMSADRKQPVVVPVDWKGAWRIHAAGELPVDHPENFRWHGDMALDGDFVYTSGGTNVALQKPAFVVRVDEQVVSITNFKAGLWEGSLNAPRTQIRLPSKEKKLQFETQLTLDGARPQSARGSFGEARKQPGVVSFDWKGAWRISAAGEIPMDRPETFRWNADMALDGDFIYASGDTKIALQKPAFALRGDGQMVSISDFKAGLWEGSLNATKTQIRLPSREKKLQFETQFTLDGARPQSARGSFGEARKQPGVTPFDWKGGWRINAAGEIPTDHPETFRWNAGVALDGDFAYASGDTKIALQKPAFTLRGDGQTVAISDFKAGLWEGSLEVPKTTVYLPSAKKKLRFETQLTLHGARLQSIVNSFGDSEKQPGVVQCDWKGGGEFGLASLTGSGALSIAEAEFFRMPLLGTLNLIFMPLAPMFHKDAKSTMTVNHRVAAGTLNLEDLKLDSEQTHLEANGTIDLAREYAQLTAKGRLRQIAGLATVLLTSLLEFKGEGPVDNVRWQLKSIPGVGQIGHVAKKATGTATEAVKGVGKAVKGLIELPGKLLPGQ